MADQKITELKAAFDKVTLKIDLGLIFFGHDGHIDDGGEWVANDTNCDFMQLARIVFDYARPQIRLKFLFPVVGIIHPWHIRIDAALAHVEETANDFV